MTAAEQRADRAGRGEGEEEQRQRPQEHQQQVAQLQTADVFLLGAQQVSRRRKFSTDLDTAAQQVQEQRYRNCRRKHQPEWSEKVHGNR